jgi:hypothetical protein
MKALTDNDLLFKGSCYGLLKDLLRMIPCGVGEYGYLGSSRFVAEKAIRKAALLGGHAAALALFKAALAEGQQIEPSSDEIRMAANLEVLAQKEHLPLDGGESLLCAVLVSRQLQRLATGDKRAIGALNRLLGLDALLAGLQGKVVCLEQLVDRLLEERGVSAVRALICREPNVDKALSNSFSCSSAAVPDGSCKAGLQSYIGSLRREAHKVLVSD